MKCDVWSVKSAVKCEVWSVKCGVLSVTFGTVHQFRQSTTGLAGALRMQVL